MIELGRAKLDFFVDMTAGGSKILMNGKRPLAIIRRGELSFYVHPVKLNRSEIKPMLEFIRANMNYRMITDKFALITLVQSGVAGIVEEDI